MKTLFLLLSMIIASNVFSPNTPSVNHKLNVGDGEGNASGYIMIDSNDLAYSQIRYKHATVGSLSPDLVVEDEQISSTVEMMEEKYPEFKTQYLFENRRTIIGFDAPSLEQIERLTLRIRFKLYGKIDIFNLNPRIAEENFLIKADNLYYPYGYAMLHGDISGAETKASYIQNYSLPYIGNPSLIKSLETRLAAASVLRDPNWNIKNTERFFPYVIDDPRLWDNFMSIENSDLYQKQYYVIMPCSFDIDRVWISVAGVDTDGNIVSDGLDANGNPYQGDINGQTYKYIDMPFNEVRAAYFSEKARIVRVSVSGSDVGGNNNEPHLRFGDYNFKENKFVTLLKEFWLTDSGDYIIGYANSFEVSSGHDAVLSYIPEGDFSIRIFYSSTGFAVYQNIVGEDGIENPYDATPDITTDRDNYNPFDDLFGKDWDDFGKYIAFVFGGLMIIAAGLGIYLLVSSRRSKTVVNIINDKKRKK